MTRESGLDPINNSASTEIQLRFTVVSLKHRPNQQSTDQKNP